MFTFQATFVIVLLVLSSNGEIQKDWKDPHAFGRQKNKNALSSLSDIQTECKCDACPVCPQLEETSKVCMNPDDDMATILYKRLVSSLIIEDNVPSASSLKVLQIKVTEKHLRILASSNNIRDWDGVMSEIIASMYRIDPETNFIYKAKTSWILSIFNFSYVTRLLSHTEIQFTLFLILALSLGAYFRRRYKWGIGCMILIVMCSSGYLYTYYECNRLLEVEELISMMETQHNPCEGDKSFVGSVLNLFTRNQENCYRYMR